MGGWGTGWDVGSVGVDEVLITPACGAGGGGEKARGVARAWDDGARRCDA